MSSRAERKRAERERRKQEARQKRRNSWKERIEEFKLNRQGKTKRRRSDVMSRHRRTDRILTLLIAIVTLLLIIAWVFILFI